MPRKIAVLVLVEKTDVMTETGYHKLENQGPVVQSIVSLTMSLRRQLVKNMLTTYANTSLFLLEKCVNLLHCKRSHIFPTKIASYL